jgi:NRAMP (natural resistance-associated macrophage protein)-like metal ion transporter
MEPERIRCSRVSRADDVKHAPSGFPKHHPHRFRLRGFGYFKRIGPGLITGAADDDPSGIGTYSQVGAQFRFGLVWTSLVSLPLASAVQETAARLGMVSGKGLAALIKERFPRPALWFAVTLLVAANTFNIGADLGSMAAALKLVVPIPIAVLVPGFALVILLLEVFLSYRRYSRVLRFLALSLLAYVAELFILEVDWAAVVHALVVPQVRFDRQHLAALVAIFGTTISPYLFFWQCAEEVEERDEQAAGPLTKPQIRAMRADVVAGMSAGVGVMFAIMVATGSTLGAHGSSTIQTADEAARALRPIAGPAASLLFAAGIVGTGLLAIPTLAGSAAYAIAETFGWREGLSRRPREAPGFYGVIAAAMLIGLALNFLGTNPIRALFLSAVLNGLAAPPLILLMLILSNRALPGPARGGRLSYLLVAVSFLLMGGLPVLYLLARR